MPSNRSISPPKRRAHRSASSSSLIAPVVTTAHVRRLSRVPSSTISPSASSQFLPRLSSHHSFPITPDCEPDLFPPQALRAPSLSDHPLSLPRLGAAVDALIRPPAKGKPPRPYDPPALFILFSVFLTIFILLIVVLRSFFPSTIETTRVLNTRRVEENLDRVARNLPPRQFWPLPDSEQRALQPLPTPLFTNVSIDRIWQTRFLAARHVQPPLRLSVVAACKDRTAFLQTALPAWLEVLHPRHDEVLLVDWATKAPDFVPLSEVVRAIDDPRLSVVTLTHSTPWVLSRAYNLAFSLARGEWLLKLDCDTALRGNFMSAHPLPKAEEHTFYRFDWATARDRNEQHLNGIFLARTHDIHAIHGYDERITTYGWEDSDLYSRLQKGEVNLVPALKALAIDVETVHHMTHDDSLREAGQHLSMGPVLQTQVNSQAAEGIPSWTLIGGVQKTRFKFDIFSRDARFLGATVVQAPGALLEQVTSTRRDAIVTEAINRVLHDWYGLPWFSLSEIDQSLEYVVRALASLGGGRAVTGGGVDSLVFAVVQGTVAERVVGVASAIAFARTHRRTLFLTWGDGCTAMRDDVPACKPGDFFDLDYNAPSPERRLTVSTKPVQARRTHIFQIARWKCRQTITECLAADPAFGSMVEWSATSTSSSPNGDIANTARSPDQMADVLQGKIEGKRNVLLRLQGRLPTQSTQQIQHEIRSLHVSKAVAEYMQQIGDLSEHVGLYIGPSMRSKTIEAVANRLLHENQGSANDTTATKVFFVTGPTREFVDEARRLLPASQTVSDALKRAHIAGETPEVRENVRQLGELLILSKCKEIVNDGRPSQAAITILSAIRHLQ